MTNCVIKEAVQRYPRLVKQPYYDMLQAGDGYEAICILSKRMHGTTMYIPAIRGIFYGCVTAAIAEDHNGNNMAELARRFAYSERQMRNLVK